MRGNQGNKSSQSLQVNSLSKTSGAIHAALPLLLVMFVCSSPAVPKSQIWGAIQ